LRRQEEEVEGMREEVKTAEERESERMKEMEDRRP